MLLCSPDLLQSLFPFSITLRESSSYYGFLLHAKCNSSFFFFFSLLLQIKAGSGEPERSAWLLQISSEIKVAARCYIKGDVIRKYFITYAAQLCSPEGVYYILSIPFSIPTSFLHNFSCLTDIFTFAQQPIKLAFQQPGEPGSQFTN